MKSRVILTPERKEFIVSNWKKMTDYQIGKSLDLSAGSVAALRLSIGIMRRETVDVKPNVKAYIIECFFNDIPSRVICKNTGLPRDKVIQIIGDTCFFTKRSYSTITMVMDSKVNYD